MSYNRNKPIVDTPKNEEDNKELGKAKGKKEDKSEDKSKKKKQPKASKTATRKKIRDPRIGISIGVFLMLLSIFIFLSFVSYVIGYNITGNLGETIGYWMSRNAFGIGSLFIIFLVFIAGSNLSFKGPKIGLITICKYSIMTLAWLPLFLATIFPNNNTFDVYYGVVGLYIHDLLVPYIKELGIYIILIFIIQKVTLTARKH